MIIPVAVLLLILSVRLLGGRLSRLGAVRLRGLPLVLLALLAQVVVIEVPLGGGLPERAVHIASYLAAAGFIWVNRRVPGLLVIAAGAASNGAVIALNGGVLPASATALARAGIVQTSGTFANSAVLAHPRLAVLGDVFAVPSAVPLANVFSIGDVIVVLGAGYAAYRICGTVWWAPWDAAGRGHGVPASGRHRAGGRPTAPITGTTSGGTTSGGDEPEPPAATRRGRRAGTTPTPEPAAESPDPAAGVPARADEPIAEPIDRPAARSRSARLGPRARSHRAGPALSTDPSPGPSPAGPGSLIPGQAGPADREPLHAGPLHPEPPHAGHLHAGPLHPGSAGPEPPATPIPIPWTAPTAATAEAEPEELIPMFARTAVTGDGPWAGDPGGHAAPLTQPVAVAVVRRRRALIPWPRRHRDRVDQPDQPDQPDQGDQPDEPDQGDRADQAGQPDQAAARTEAFTATTERILEPASGPAFEPRPAPAPGPDDHQGTRAELAPTSIPGPSPTGFAAEFPVGFPKGPPDGVPERRDDTIDRDWPPEMTEPARLPLPVQPMALTITPRKGRLGPRFRSR